VSAEGNAHRYGGPWFSEASALPLSGGLGNPKSLVRLLVAAMSRPRRTFALIGLLLRSPRVNLVLSDTARGRVLREHLDRRFLGLFPQNRLCQGVLFVPKAPSEYLNGRRRRTVRTNQRRAAAAGIRCEAVDSSAEALKAASLIVRRRQTPMTTEDLATLTGALPAMLDQQEVTLFLARDRAGGSLAVLAVVMDENVCLIRYAVSSSHEARWALHHHLVLTLIDRRVSYLMAASDGPFGALGLSRNEQYYQHLLGYDLCHIGMAACACDTLTPAIMRSVPNSGSSGPQPGHGALLDHES
jgi:hypothetical protein